ncbi:MAG: cyclic nucleotide-binding domain-containing protein [Synechococcales bacterium]|nr:cyclic nucleotide-binding domain-containing protein [Synechococcales bacterium]
MEKALYLLAELSDRDFDWLLTAGEMQSVPVGKALICEGETINAVYLVMTGRLSVTVKALANREIARLSSGEVVGEMSFLDDRAPSATVTALDDSLVWAINRSKLALKLSQDKAFAANFYHALAVWLSHRLRGTISRLGYSYGYGKDLPDGSEAQDDASDSRPKANPKARPSTPDNLAIARIRLDWLLSRMKDTH